MNANNALEATEPDMTNGGDGYLTSADMLYKGKEIGLLIYLDNHYICTRIDVR